MKAFKLLLIPAILFILISCSKEEQETAKGFVKFEDKNYEFNFGYFEIIEIMPGHQQGSRVNIYLSDKEIPFKNGIWNVEGPRGVFVDFALYHPGSDLKNISDYYPLRTENNNIDFSDEISYIVSHAVTLNIKPSENENSSWNYGYRNFLWDDGSLTIDGDHSDYSITFTFKKNGEIVTGEYNGKLEDISSL